MDHGQASAQVADWLAGRLDREGAAAIQAHVSACGECGEVADTLRRLGAEVEAHGEALFSPHPSADQLARFALDPNALLLPALATLGAHVRACPTCDAERVLLREANRPSLARTLSAWWAGAPGAGALLRPAAAVLALLLLYPAYLGVVEYPRARMRATEAESRTREAARTVTPGSRTPAWPGSGVDVLTLTSETRGAAGALPTVRLRPGQPAQPVLVDHALPAGVAEVTVLLRRSSGEEVWRITASRAELWSARERVISLLVPTDRLAPGEYRLELFPVGSITAEFVARFLVMGHGNP